MSDLPSRAQCERELSEALILVFMDYESRAKDSIASIRWGEFQGAVHDAVRKPLEDAFIAANMALLQSQGQEAAAPGDRATNWAEAQAVILAAIITEQTQQRTADALRRSSQTGEDLAESLQATFGRARAEVVAATEITRAISVGEAAAVAFILAQTGEEPRAIWITERDDRVCPICAPLHQMPEDKWRHKFAAGPPAHPNCRCWLEYAAA